MTIATTHPKTKAALADLAKAQELMDKDEFEAARDLVERVRTFCSREGVRSGHVAWMLAILHDYLEDLPMALKYAQEALEADPVSPSYHRSFDIVTDRMRRTLAEDRRRPDDPETPRLYELLVRADAADVTSHLAMARYHAHRGDANGALRILDALTLLAPSHRDAWVLKAAAARALGKEELARDAEFEAAALADTRLATFPMPRTAQG